MKYNYEPMTAKPTKIKWQVGSPNFMMGVFCVFETLWNIFLIQKRKYYFGPGVPKTKTKKRQGRQRVKEIINLIII
jgi:hypothetical protein